MPLHIVQGLLWREFQEAQDEVTKTNPVVILSLHILLTEATKWKQRSLENIICMASKRGIRSRRIKSVSFTWR
jgi:hypothetical protein